MTPYQGCPCPCCTARFYKDRQEIERADYEVRHNPSRYRPDMIRRAWVNAKTYNGGPENWDEYNNVYTKVPPTMRVQEPIEAPKEPIKLDTFEFQKGIRHYAEYTVEYVECEAIRVWERIIRR